MWFIAERDRKTGRKLAYIKLKNQTFNKESNTEPFLDGIPLAINSYSTWEQIPFFGHPKMWGGGGGQLKHRINSQYSWLNMSSVKLPEKLHIALLFLAFIFSCCGKERKDWLFAFCL